MEGKLKEKLESMGLAFLCLSIGRRLPFSHWCKWKNFLVIGYLKTYFCSFIAGMSGLICFSLTIRLAYASLAKKLQAREMIKEQQTTVTVSPKSEPVTVSVPMVNKSIAIINAFNSITDVKSRNRALTIDSLMQEVMLLKMN